MKKALAIITYARPHYLELVLPSILNQRILGLSIDRFFDLYLFQDGLAAGESETIQKSHAEAAYLRKRYYPAITQIVQSANLGIAMHYDAIERYLFQQKQYDYAVFCEDDLIFAPGYLQTIHLLADKFADDPRIGMISAHHRAPKPTPADSLAGSNDYRPMSHGNGYGLSRRFWEKRQPLVDCYLNVIRGVPYSERPHELVYAWLNLLGFQPKSSSQDYIKQCATVALGACRISSYANYGLPLGHGDTVICRQPMDAATELSEASRQGIYQYQLNECVIDPDACDYSNPEFSAIWQEKLATGDFNPENLTPPNSQKSDAPNTTGKIWSKSDILETPHMEPEGVELLARHAQFAKVFLEFGAGGSSVLMARLGVPEIHSVDSDQGFLSAVKDKIDELFPDSVINCYYVNIGETKEWGNPVDKSSANLWPKYCVAPWEALISQNLTPDLVLIDGRFRVSCFLVSLIFAKPGTIILFDDYLDRPYYHLVEKYITPLSIVGRMAEFRVENAAALNEIIIDLLTVATDHR